MDMKEGCRYGMLTLTGGFIIDRFSARRYEAVCDCGVKVYRHPRYMRESICCSVKNHDGTRKESVSKSSKDKLLKDKYIGKSIRECIVVDVCRNKDSHSFMLKCEECGYVFRRKRKAFIKGNTGGCPKNHADDIERNKNKYEKVRKQKAIEAARRKKERIKQNKGMNRFKDVSGQTIGRFMALEYAGVDESTKKKVALFRCICECGEECLMTAAQMKIRKYCDKEYAEIRKEQGKDSARKRRDKSIANGTYKRPTFRNKNSRKISKFSQQVYDKYEGVCQKCKNVFPKDKSHAHHMIPLKQNQSLITTLSNGILFCRRCHEAFHKTYGWIGFDAKDVFKFIS